MRTCLDFYSVTAIGYRPMPISLCMDLDRNLGALTFKFDRATLPFLKSTCDMKPIDMGKNISDMTGGIS